MHNKRIITFLFTVSYNILSGKTILVGLIFKSIINLQHPLWVQHGLGTEHDKLVWRLP